MFIRYWLRHKRRWVQIFGKIYLLNSTVFHLPLIGSKHMQCQFLNLLLQCSNLEEETYPQGEINEYISLLGCSIGPLKFYCKAIAFWFYVQCCYVLSENIFSITSEVLIIKWWSSCEKHASCIFLNKDSCSHTLSSCSVDAAFIPLL